VSGARWAREELLDRHPDRALTVYAVWLPMVPGDARSRWPAHLLDDPRVRHFWDGDRVVGEWFAANDLAIGAPFEGETMWDAFYVFPPDASWRDVPAPLLAHGRPIIEERKALRRAVVRATAVR
jgi:hypothetical protein